MAFRKHTAKRAESGTSLLEMLVSVAIMSVAVAGLTEMTWLNTAWSSRLFNHVDNNYSAQLFLERLGQATRKAYSVDVSSDGSNLTLEYFDFDSATGYPKTTPLKKIYAVVPDPQTQAAQAKTGIPMYMITEDGQVVLRGIVGPHAVLDNKLAVFQYSPPDPASPQVPPKLSAKALPSTNCVVVNLEMQRLDYGNSRGYGANAPSVFGIRNQYFVRNALAVER